MRRRQPETAWSDRQPSLCVPRKGAAFLLAAGASLAFQALAAEPTPGLKPGDEVPPAFAQHVAGPDQGTLTCPI
jgi:hypothetical protein